jgi:hypothetical protein
VTEARNKYGRFPPKYCWLLTERAFSFRYLFIQDYFLTLILAAINKYGRFPPKILLAAERKSFLFQIFVYTGLLLNPTPSGEK